MQHGTLKVWFFAVSTVLVLFGILFVFFGLKVLPVSTEVLLPWESSLYGAIMVGWGATLLLIGGIAFHREDPELKRALWVGLTLWLVIEAAASAYFKVWFNVGVDAAVLILFRSHCYATAENNLFGLDTMENPLAVRDGRALRKNRLNFKGS